MPSEKKKRKKKKGGWVAYQKGQKHPLSDPSFKKEEFPDSICPKSLEDAERQAVGREEGRKRKRGIKKISAMFDFRRNIAHKEKVRPAREKKKRKREKKESGSYFKGPRQLSSR